jgi:pimeloyl-ACP methyl ester carboxylesterase
MRQRLQIVLVAVVLAVFAVSAGAQQPAAPRPAANNVEVGQKDGFFTTTDGIKIHYLRLGETGSWVVLIHGYSDSAQRMWFNTGIAPELAKRHRVVAIDNRNHGQSDKPQPGGSGRAQDVVELMNHLQINRAHIHGYSMGGAITGQLLGMIPDRFITAGFGGSGMAETNPAFRAEAEAMDDALPKATGAATRRQRACCRAASGAGGRSDQALDPDSFGERIVRQSLSEDASPLARGADVPERDPARQDAPHRNCRRGRAFSAVHRRDRGLHQHLRRTLAAGV